MLYVALGHLFEAFKSWIAKKESSCLSATNENGACFPTDQSIEANTTRQQTIEKVDA